MPRPALQILVAEDNPGDADLLAERLSEALSPAFRILHVTTLRGALERLAHGGIDAVVLDLNLPDSTGTDTVRRVREAFPDMPILVLSGQLDAELHADALREGAADVLRKDEPPESVFWRSIVYAIERQGAREHQRQLEELVEGHPDAILITSDAGVVRYVNRAALELFARTRDDFVGELLTFAVKDGEPSEIRVLRKDGERVGEVRVARIRWRGEPALLGSIRDVTLRKQTDALQARSAELMAQNRRIQEASRLKSEFLANMSHELRTPLNAILGFTQILQSGVAGPMSPQQKEYLGDVLTSSRHLLRLINDILDLAKVESGKMEFQLQPADMSLVVPEVLSIVRGLAAQKRIRLETDIDPAAADVLVDPSRLKQILYNYLSNAIKFTPEDGCVTVRVRPEGTEWFRVEVEDTGIGVAEEDLGRIFVEFEQLDSSTSKRYPGTGLGLALTKQIAEAHGGRVEVRSTPGAGSTFSAILPRAPRSDEASRPHAEAAPRKQGEHGA